MPSFGRRDALKLAAASTLGACSRARHPGELADGTLGAPSETEAPSVEAEVTPPPATFTLAFGSCNKAHLPQPLWSDVRALAPDAWAWLGDIVYADTDDVGRTRRLYAEQAARADYAALVAQMRVVGIWDDHDFGHNDAGSEYHSRVASQAALLDFLGEPADSPRRAQLGTYTSYVFGEDERQLKLIMLDGRYHRDAPGPHGDTLGEPQWAWFENELRSSRARVNVVTSGYQVLPLDHSSEKWGNFPAARARLLDLIASTHAPGVVLLSGDRHFAELSCLSGGPSGYPLFELTSSGLTHSYENADEPNRYRVGSLYPHRNFGTLRVDWSAETLTLEARARGGGVVIGQTVPLAALTS